MPAAPPWRVRHVVSSFVVVPHAIATAQRKLMSLPVHVEGPGPALAVFQRSGKVRTFQQKWAACSGSIEPKESPADCALRELREETGLSAAHRPRAALVGAGRPLLAVSEAARTAFVVHPFLVETHGDAAAPAEWMAIDWEHSLWTAVRPAELQRLDAAGATVPRLFDAFSRVAPALGPAEDGFHARYAAVLHNRRDGSGVLARAAVEALRGAVGPGSHDAQAAVRRVLDVAHLLAHARPSMVCIGVAVAQVVSEALQQCTTCHPSPHGFGHVLTLNPGTTAAQVPFVRPLCTGTPKSKGGSGGVVTDKCSRIGMCMTIHSRLMWEGNWRSHGGGLGLPFRLPAPPALVWNPLRPCGFSGGPRRFLLNAWGLVRRMVGTL